MATDRLSLLRGIRVLPVTKEAADLARMLVTTGLVQGIAAPDAVHIALASAYQTDFPYDVELQAHRESAHQGEDAHKDKRFGPPYASNV